MPKIICISDTHGLHDKITVPMGDILIHAGDMSMMGRPHEIKDFSHWLLKLPHRYKICIAGNHDWLFEKDRVLAEECLLSDSIIYLQDSGVEIMGLKFWGSPVTPWFCNWAFNCHRGYEIKQYWDKIPDNTDVLITHGPSYGTLDQRYTGDYRLGCEDLSTAISRVKPKIHICGHIHGGAGVEALETIFINASVLDEQYQPNGKQFIVAL